LIPLLKGVSGGQEGNHITEDEVIVYGHNLEKVAQHLLLPRTLIAQRQVCSSHHPHGDTQQRYGLLQERFSELGPVACRFLDELVQQQRQGKDPISAAPARRVCSGVHAEGRRIRETRWFTFPQCPV
jgi:hypothetical protein